MRPAALRRCLIAAIAALGLLVASGLWSGHGYAHSHGHDHCELCVHLGGTAPSPIAGAPSRAPASGLALASFAPKHERLPLQSSPAHRPRGPPTLPSPA